MEIGTLPLAPLTWRQLLILLAGRLAFNASFRVVYPLLEFLARGFNVDPSTISILVTVQVAATLISPLGGSLADTYGERAAMIIGLLLFCVGSVVCAVAYDFMPFLLGYALIGSGMALYNPSSQAYASARTSYARRGQVLGLLELGWALSALVGVTLLSWLIGINNTWAVAFWALLAAGILVLLAIILGIPATPAIQAVRHTGPHRPSLKMLAQPSVLAALLLMFCTLLAAELIFVVYAFWLQADFGATNDQASQVFGLLGFVELGGSLGAALLVDRIGKRRTVLIAFTVVAVLQGLLPISSGNWTMFLVLFFLLDLWFEFGLVSAFPLISGILPAARGTMFSLSVAAIGLGRLFGSLIGPRIWERFGFAANGLLAAGLTLLGIVICLLFVREGEGEAGAG